MWCTSDCHSCPSCPPEVGWSRNRRWEFFQLPLKQLWVASQFVSHNHNQRPAILVTVKPVWSRPKIMNLRTFFNTLIRINRRKELSLNSSKFHRVLVLLTWIAPVAHAALIILEGGWFPISLVSSFPSPRSMSAVLLMSSWRAAHSAIWFNVERSSIQYCADQCTTI